MSGTRRHCFLQPLSPIGCQSPVESPFGNTMSTVIFYLTILTLMFTVYSNPTGRLASLKSIFISFSQYWFKNSNERLNFWALWLCLTKNVLNGG